MILPGNSIVQVAWVVNDLASAIERFRKTLNTGPFTVFEHIQLNDFLYRGKPLSADFSMAAVQAGDVQLELIEQHDDTASVYRDLYPRGQEGFHHVAVLVPDVAAEVARYTAQGFEIGCQGRFGDSGFAYVDTSPVLGHMVEVLPDNAAMRAFFDTVRKASEG
jgi:catechol 2,3-dioxygenase-like lactoylglutathione lyase family enzyme